MPKRIDKLNELKLSSALILRNDHTEINEHSGALRSLVYFFPRGQFIFLFVPDVSLLKSFYFYFH